MYRMAACMVNAVLDFLLAGGLGMEPWGRCGEI